MSDDHEILKRITARPDVFGGKPIIRDMRIAVEHVLGMLASGETTERILSEYPFLEAEDIRACCSTPTVRWPVSRCKNAWQSSRAVEKEFDAMRCVRLTGSSR